MKIQTRGKRPAMRTSLRKQASAQTIVRIVAFVKMKIQSRKILNSWVNLHYFWNESILNDFYEHNFLKLWRRVSHYLSATFRAGFKWYVLSANAGAQRAVPSKSRLLNDINSGSSTSLVYRFSQFYINATK